MTTSQQRSLASQHIAARLAAHDRPVVLPQVIARQQNLSAQYNAHR